MAATAAQSAPTAARRGGERRQVAAAEARAIRDDPADRAEIREIQEDRAALIVVTSSD